MSGPTQALGVTFSLKIETLQDMRDYCTIISKTELVPKAYRGKPDDIMVAVSMGQALGLNFFMSLQSIASINGVPAVYGDAGLAIVRNSGLLEDFDEWMEIDGQRVSEVPDLIDAAAKGRKIVQWCKSKRKDMSQPRVTTYSVSDAKIAKLWLKKGYEGKDTPWVTNPGRMLMFRARGFNLRDEFGDVLKGFKFAEEVQDYDLDMEQTASGVYQAAGTDVPPTTTTVVTTGTKLSDLLKANAPKTNATPPEPTPEPEPTPAVPDSAPTPTDPPAPVETAPAPPTKPAPTEPPAPLPTGSAHVGEIQTVIAKLSKTGKGSALLNGIQKMFKLKNELYPSDASHHPLFLQALKDAEKKI